MIGLHHEDLVEHIGGLFKMINPEVGRPGIVGAIGRIEGGCRAKRNLIDPLIESIQIASEQTIKSRIGRESDLDGRNRSRLIRLQPLLHIDFVYEFLRL